MDKDLTKELCAALLLDELSKAQAVCGVLWDELFDRNTAPVEKFQYDYERFHNLASVVMDYLSAAIERVEQAEGGQCCGHESANP